jgi:hypothetical protein
MPTNVRGANLPAPKGLPSARNLSGTPMRGGPNVPRPTAPSAKPPPLPKGTKVAVKTTSRGSTGKVANPFAGIPRTFQGAPKLAQAYKATPPEKSQPSGGHSLFSLHTLESGANAIGSGLQSAENVAKGALSATYGSGGKSGKGTAAPGATIAPGAAAANPLTTVGSKGASIGLALSRNPVGTTEHTLTSIPSTLNAMVTGLGRTGLETTAELIAAAERGHGLSSPREVLGVKPGAPGQALGELAKSAVGEYVGPKSRYGQPIGKDAERMEKQGMLPEVLDAITAVGTPTAAAGRMVSKGVEAAGTGADVLPKVAAYREAVTHAYQAPNVQEFLRRTDLLPPEPTKAELKLAATRESVSPRPHLRQASGSEAVSQKRGAAVVEQKRSPNYFVARGQTALDNARRSYQQAQLQKVMEARQAAQENPNLPHELIPQAFAPQLAYDTRRGEVTPLMQPGGKASGRFIGAERKQHIGQSYAKGEKVQARRAIVDPYSRDFQKQLSSATKQQKAVLVHAKEGMLNLDDPAKAAADLKEIHDQALEGRDKLTIPIQHVKAGSDVARETGAVLDHIKQHGPESVFTPAFKKLVETGPDERLTSHLSPWVQAHPDQAIARKYLPQVNFLKSWAERHPTHPDAQWTKNAADQTHRLLEEGHDLRHMAITGKPPDEHTLSDQLLADLHGKSHDQIHAAATDKFASAKNLADELAQAHGKPTDRAYVQHTRTMDAGHYLHTVSNVSPADAKRWMGVLQKAGYRSTDPELVLRALAKPVRDFFSQQNVNDFQRRFGVQLPRKDMTGREVHQWLADSGRNPNHYEVMHLGKLRQELVDRSQAEHLAHLDSDPEAHAHAEQQMWERAGHIPASDTTKGASLINKAAADEMRASFKNVSAAGRIAGKMKGTMSKYMLGTSLPWLSTMSAMTYPVQSLMGGAGAANLVAALKRYGKMTSLEKAKFDERFGVDSPYRASTHGFDTQHMASTLPHNLQGLADTLKAAHQSPTGQLLSKANPLKAVADQVLKMERGPRRYARINVAMKGIKNEAVRQMITEMHGAQTALNKFELGTKKLVYTGRMPPERFVQKALDNTKAMEDVMAHVNNALGEWKNTTAFERNTLNKYVMFYPWLRYSLKLAAHTLPAHHPLLYAAALKLGTWEHKNLTELLGTEPGVGTIYLGKGQPNVPAEKRQFSELNVKQANPVLNTALSAIGGEPSELLDVLPPYMTSAVSWIVNRNLSTGKPLKGAGLEESKGIKKGRPAILPFMFHENVEEPFGLARIAAKQLTGGRPQSAESAPLLGLEKPVQYSRRTESKIARERGKGSLLSNLLQELFPIVPHSGGNALATKISIERAEAKEAAKKARKEAARKNGTAPPPPPPPPPPGP